MFNFFWNNLHRLSEKQAQRIVYGLASHGLIYLAWNIADHCNSEFCDELLVGCFYYYDGRHKRSKQHGAINR